MHIRSKSGSKFSSTVVSRRNLESMKVPAPRATYHVVCIGPDGNVKWEDSFHNLITTEGKNDVLSKYLKGSAYTAAFYVGLKGTGSPAAGDTLASHAGWSEDTNYSGNRKALTLGAVSAGSVDNSGSPASFAINGTTTIFGAFVCTVDTGTSGILYSAGNFASSKAVSSGDTLNVTVTLTQADDGV